MKTATKNGKSRANGTLLTRKELLAAHERALKRMSRMTADEGFASLVKAGIYTPNGKLMPRYGGMGCDGFEPSHVTGRPYVSR
jgi:hypothetical protein